ncbi:MAG: hypothetical protein Kow00105_05020 [Phycisphaeraceae bacterium]
MLALSQTTGYAVLALSCLQDCCDTGHWILVKDIAACTGIPQPYLSKLMNQLTASGLIEAKRGYRGGYRLKRPADQISVLEVAEAVEGEKWLPRCLLGLEDCCELRACPTHAFWSKERERIEQELRQRTLKDIAEFERQRGQRLGGCPCI